MSSVTPILTGRLNLNRLTSYLLDATAIASSLSPTRQPQQLVSLEIELVGNTVSASGRVTVYSTAGAGVSQYVVQDRVLSTRWAIKVSDGVINISSTGSSASDEPIVEDSLVSGLNWKIFVSNGVIGVEATAIEDNDAVRLVDTVTATTYLLIVSDGVLGISTSASSSEVFTFSENGSKIGTTNFFSITGITTSGITDGFIKVKGINKLGQPVNQEIVVASSVPCRFYTQNGRIKMTPPGQELPADYKIMLEPMQDILENDLVYPLSDVVGLTLGSVIFVERIWDFQGLTHHTEASIVRP